MHSIFELKTSIPYDHRIFDQMRSKAIELLRNTEPLKYTQAIVLFSASGNEYSTVVPNACSEEKTAKTALLEKLKASGDTKITYALCMWYDQNVDIPSYSFRKMLTLLNSENAESLLLVMTANGTSALKLSATMK